MKKIFPVTILAFAAIFTLTGCGTQDELNSANNTISQQRTLMEGLKKEIQELKSENSKLSDENGHLTKKAEIQAEEDVLRKAVEKLEASLKKPKPLGKTS